MATKLTDLSVEKQKPNPATRLEIADAGVPGLYLIIQPSGAKSWALRYRAASKSTKLTLGPYPAVSLRAAREAARVALGKAAAGTDPASEKREARAAARRPKPEHDLVEKVAATFVERYAKKNRSWQETERVLKKEIAGPWAGRRLSEIKRADVHELLDGIVDRGSPIMANRALAALRRMCGWAAERGLIDTSPCAGIKAPSAERSRDRVLSADELKAALQGSQAIGWPFGPLVQLLVLTGQRRDEVAEMRWAEIDLERRTWTIPRERVKNDQAHTVPLSEAAVEILRGLPKVEGKAGFVFSTNGKTPVSGFSRAKERIDAYLDEAPRWTLHDLRRTAASGMAGLGIAVHVVEAVLNHRSGTIKGVAAVYNRYSYDAEKRAALEAWGRHVRGIISCEPAGNVVPIKARG
jgi:integrase